MDQSALLADHIDGRVEELMAACRAAVERDEDGPAIQGLSASAFADHLPDLLDLLADRLRGRSRETEARRTSRLHGRVRWRQGFDVRDVVTELSHLRSILRDAAFEFAISSSLGLSDLSPILEVIDQVVDEALADSVEQHRRDSRARDRRALVRSDDLRDEAINDRQRLAALLENMPACVWVVGPEGQIIAENAEASGMLAGKARSAIGADVLGSSREVFETYRLDGTPHAPGELPGARALRGERIAQEELLWETPRGRRCLVVNAAPVLDAAAVVVGAIVVGLDVTEAKVAEREIRRQSHFISAVTECMAGGLAAIDVEGRISYLNPAARRLLGRAIEDLAGCDMHESLNAVRSDGSTFPREDCPIWSAFSRRSESRGDVFFVRGDGSNLPVSFTLAPLFDGDQFAGAVLTFEEISDRKQLEAALALASSRLAAIIEGSPAMIWRSDPQGRCDFVNAAWREFAEDSRDADDAWLDGLHPDEAEPVRSEFLKRTSGSEPFELTYRRLRRDGQYRWLVDRAVPYRDPVSGTRGFLGSALDITEGMELRQELDRQRAIAEQSSRHKTRLVTALSHDARTPLNAVVLSADLLELLAPGGDDPEVAEALRTIRHGVRNVLDLFNDLLDLGRLESGGEVLELSRFGLAETLEECLGSIEVQARVKGLDATLDLDGLDHLEVRTDRAKLKQVLGNLLSNALRYTDHGSIRLSARPTDEELRIEVQDTGPGIADGDRERIFEEFARLDPTSRLTGSGTDSGTGLGLGLAICRRLADLLGGRIELSSAPGVGSTFALILPLKPLSPESTYEEIARSTSSSDPLELGGVDGVPEPAPTGPILVADDHAPSRLLLIRVLQRLGYEAEQAGDGRHAVELARTIRPRAILMDLHMPDMDGVEAARIVRAETGLSHLPIIALTGDLDPANRARLRSAGFRGFLPKPVTIEALSRLLNEMLGPHNPTP